MINLMSISKRILLKEAEKILLPSLECLGYKFIKSPPAKGEVFWFEKKPIHSDSLYRIIEFQFIGFSNSEFYKFCINIMRRSYRDFDNPPDNITYDDYIFSRLSPKLWDKNSTVMDHWWWFNSLDELRACYKEVLKKIINFGIPYLE